MDAQQNSFPAGYHIKWPWWSGKNSPLPLTTTRRTRADENRQLVIHIMLGTAPDGTSKLQGKPACGYICQTGTFEKVEGLPTCKVCMRKVARFKIQ